MAYEFPASPEVGDTYSSFAWNGQAWIRTSGALAPDLEGRLAALEAKAEDIRNMFGPTGADGTPADFNYVVIDKATGQVRSIDPDDYIVIE